MSKKHNKVDPEALESAYALFNLAPDIKLKKKEKKVLHAIYQYDDMDFYSLCEWFDMRPSKLDEILDILDCYGLIDYDDTEDALVIIPTPLGERLCETSKTERKADEELKKFLDSMDEEELLDFCTACTEEMYPDDADAEKMEDDSQEDISVEIYEDGKPSEDKAEEDISVEIYEDDKPSEDKAEEEISVEVLKEEPAKEEIGKQDLPAENAKEEESEELKPGEEAPAETPAEEPSKKKSWVDKLFG